jgi:hypothetical protein
MSRRKGEITRADFKRNGPHHLALPAKKVRGLTTPSRITCAALRAVPAMLRSDPTEGVRVKIPNTRGWHTWSDEAIGQYRAYWSLGTQQRLVMQFALEAVSRRAEVIRLGSQHVKNGRIRIEHVHGSKPVDIPLTPAPEAACAAMPRHHTLFVFNSRGRQWSPEGLGTGFAQWATEAGPPANCRRHGLKKGGMRAPGGERRDRSRDHGDLRSSQTLDGRTLHG